MTVSKLLKAVSIILGVLFALAGYGVGTQNPISDEFMFIPALSIWATGFIVCLLLFAFGEMLRQQCYTNYLLEQQISSSKGSGNQSYTSDGVILPEKAPNYAVKPPLASSEAVASTSVNTTAVKSAPSQKYTSNALDSFQVAPKKLNPLVYILLFAVIIFLFFVAIIMFSGNV